MRGARSALSSASDPPLPWQVEEKSERVKEPPTITLLGPRFIEILVGDPYAACTKFSPLTEICDKGASAQDPKDGVLDASVRPCRDKRRSNQPPSGSRLSSCWCGRTLELRTTRAPAW